MDDHDEREPGTIRLDDPWRDDTGDGDPHPGPVEIPAPRTGKAWGVRVDPERTDRVSPPPAPGDSDPEPAGTDPRRTVYLDVHRSPAFREVRRRYRRFVLPATVLFLGWYFAYVVTSTTAPEFMARPVPGGVNVAFLAGLGQFATTFLFTWAYARHARLRRDRAAMDLRWAVYEQNRQQNGDTGQEQER